MRNLKDFSQLSHMGKITLLSVSVMGLFAVLLLLLNTGSVFHTDEGKALAANATTSVTVLNTPPQWTVDAQESSESSTTTPTNSGSTISFVATANDASNDNYYLIICKTGTVPTPNSGAAPTCNGGFSNQWAVSGATASSSQATAATSTYEVNAEKNDWWAWICDGNTTGPQCNSSPRRGSGTTQSPFVVNHRPTFTAFSDNSPVNPGGTVTWTSTATDTDQIRGMDSIKLFACRANDFTGSNCGAGGIYASSTLATTSDPSAVYSVPNPNQDGTYTAFGFVIDQFNHAASGGSQGTDSILVINNLTPTMSNVTLNDTDLAGPLTLSVEQGRTNGFSVKFTATDQNSCVANGSTTPELRVATINVYRSGIASTSCSTLGQFNTNNCYTNAASSTGLWATVVCTQDSGSCNGSTDSNADWTCTFPLWYNADPTDANTQFPSENWLANANIADDNFATSTSLETSSGVELQSFLAYTVSSSTITFGSLQPGQQNDPLVQTTPTLATGNVGLDQSLYGDPMCTTYPSCSGSSTNTIDNTEQKYATSSVAYGSASAFSLPASTSPALFGLHVPKTTATSSPQTRSTYWGIRIPAAITVSGDYVGRDTLIGVMSSSTNW